MWMMEYVKMLVLTLAAGAGVVFLLMGTLGAIAAAMLSARITHEQEQEELEQDGKR